MFLLPKTKIPFVLFVLLLAGLTACGPRHRVRCPGDRSTPRPDPRLPAGRLRAAIRIPARLR